MTAGDSSTFPTAALHSSAASALGTLKRPFPCARSPVKTVRGASATEPLTQSNFLKQRLRDTQLQECAPCSEPSWQVCSHPRCNADALRLSSLSTPAPTSSNAHPRFQRFPILCVEHALGKINRTLKRGGRHAFLQISKEGRELFDVDGGDHHHKVCLRLFRRHADSRLGHVDELFGRTQIPQGWLDALLFLVEVLQEKCNEAIQREIKLETKRPLFLSPRLLAHLVQMSYKAAKAMQ
jgi:hypothetical protein